MDQVSYIRMIAALLVVIGLLLGLYWGLRRFTAFRPSGSEGDDLRVGSWRQLDARRRLAVITWGEEEHLVLVGQTSETLIASRPARSGPAKAASSNPEVVRDA